MKKWWYGVITVVSLVFLLLIVQLQNNSFLLSPTSSNNFTIDTSVSSGSNISIKDLFDSGYYFINTEGQNAMVNDLVIVNDQDEGRIMKVISIPAGTSTNDYVRIRDIITSTDYDSSTGLNNATTAARSIGYCSPLQYPYYWPELSGRCSHQRTA